MLLRIGFPLLHHLRTELTLVKTSRSFSPRSLISVVLRGAAVAIAKGTGVQARLTEIDGAPQRLSLAHLLCYTCGSALLESGLTDLSGNVCHSITA